MSLRRQYTRLDGQQYLSHLLAQQRWGGGGAEGGIPSHPGTPPPPGHPPPWGGHPPPGVGWGWGIAPLFIHPKPLLAHNHTVGAQSGPRWSTTGQARVILVGASNSPRPRLPMPSSRPLTDLRLAGLRKNAIGSLHNQTPQKAQRNRTATITSLISAS